MEPLCNWRLVDQGGPGIPRTWKLFVGRGKSPRSVATVWEHRPSYCVWHTWDRDGVGGENDTSESLEQAQALASLCAIRQGFI